MSIYHVLAGFRILSLSWKSLAWLVAPEKISGILFSWVEARFIEAS